MEINYVVVTAIDMDDLVMQVKDYQKQRYKTAGGIGIDINSINNSCFYQAMVKEEEEEAVLIAATIVQPKTFWQKVKELFN